jgi:4-amino-4-deoxy-L-arabinose transferase-like glycosyltransferase
MPGTGNERRHLAVGFALLGLACLLRFPSLTLNSLWIDELFVANAVRYDWGYLFAELQGDVHPPLFAIGAKVWASAFGPSDLTLRVFAALLGAAAVPGAWWLLRRPLGEPTALATALLLAAQPSHVVASQELRPYAVGVLASLLLLRQALLCAEATDSRSSVALGLASAIAMYLHYAFAPLVLAALVVVLMSGVDSMRERTKAVARAAGLASVLYLPWLSTAWHHLRHGHEYIKRPDGNSIAQVFEGTLAANESGLALLVGVGILAFLLRRDDDAEPKVVGRDPQRDTALLLLAAVPIAVAYVISSLPGGRAILTPKVAMLWAGPLLIVVARGLLRLGVAGRVLIAVMLALSFGRLLNADVYSRAIQPDNRGAAALVAERAGAVPGRKLVVYTDRRAEYFDWYLRDHALATDVVAWLPEHAERVRQALAAGPTVQAAYLVGGHNPVAREVGETLAAGATAHESFELTGMHVDEFVYGPDRAP